MPTTAWRFRSTEGADGAVLRLRQLDAQELIDIQDLTVLRWPQYATEPVTHEHVTDDGNKMSSLVRKFTHDRIDPSMIESVKGDMTPGTSALVLLSAGAAVEAVAQALRGQGMELIRSDLSVQEQDQLRDTFG
jgi:uncharacterized membrane protein